MGNYKGATEGGSGGKRGYSGMEHWVKTKEIKDSSRTIRRQEDLRYSKEGIDEVTRKHLIPFWFPLEKGYGIGVTAYSEEEAFGMAQDCLNRCYPDQTLGSPIVNVTTSKLDQGHVISNMGPITLLGVWFPKENL